MHFIPHKYQQRAIDFMREVPRCGVFMDMGLGKTVCTLTVLQELLANGSCKKVLIVAPLRVALTTWPDEIRKWSHTGGLNYSIICGDPVSRMRRAEDVNEIHIINRENVVWLVKYLGKRWPYDALVIDESSSFKNPSAKRTRALRSVYRRLKYIIALTGTPTPNGLIDLWSQIYLLDRGERLGKTFTGYKNHYFVQSYSGYNWDLNPGADTVIYGKIDDICMSMSAADYLDLPEKIINVVRIDLPPKAQDVYDDLKNDLFALLGDEVIDIPNAAAMVNKCLQLSNGSIYVDDSADWINVHREKLEKLAEIIEDTAPHPVLVAYQFRFDLARLQQRFESAEVLGRDPETVARWNRGEIPILLAHPASAGHGLNLQAGGNIIVWYGLNWSMELYEQFNARLHRQGQAEPVIIHHLIARDTIDESVMGALRRKIKTQKELLEYLKANETETC